MNTDKLSTGGASPSAKSKKSEGEKRKSPSTPLREKGKGKERRRGSLQNRLSRAHMRTRLREALDADLDIAVRAFGGTPTDRRIWAKIAWRVGVEEFHHALINKLAEDSADNAPRRPAATFQAFLNARFPKPETVLDENTSACSKPSRDTGVKPCPEFINYGHRCQSGECGGAVAERCASLPGIGADAVKGGAA